MQRRTRCTIGLLAVGLLVVVAACADGTAASKRSSATTGRPGRTGFKEEEEQSTDAVSDAAGRTTQTTTAAEAQGEGTQVPVVLTATAGGRLRPTAMVSIGGATAVPLLIDTGSTGLHILASAIGSTGVQNTTVPLTESYADGSQYTGTLASAQVTIGGVTSPQPVSFMSIASVGCTAGSPNCPTPNSQTLISTNGVYGTMGVALSPSAGCAAPLYSPLLQLQGGESGFSLGGFQAASGGGSGSGTIVLGNNPPAPGGQAITLTEAQYNPPAGAATPPPKSTTSTSTASKGTAVQRTTVTTATPSTSTTSTSAPSASCQTSPTAVSQYPNGSGAWDVSTSELCWSVASSAPVCGRTTFDSGTDVPGVQVSSFPSAASTTTTGGSGGGLYNSGQTVALTAPGSSTPLWTFTTGSAPAIPMTLNSPANFLLGTTGNPFFYSGWVTYDAEHGQLVVTPTAPG